MARPTPDQIATLKREHGDDLELVTFDSKRGVFFVVRPPTPDEYQRFIDRAAEGAKQRIDALDEMARSCAVFPEEKERDSYYSRKPAATTTLGTHALELAGMSEERSEKLLPPSTAERRATTCSRRARWWPSPWPSGRGR
jgi:hypothetical protein